MERGEVQAKIGTEEERRSLHEQARKAGQIQQKQCNPEVGGSEIGDKNASSSGRLKKLPKADTRTPKCNNHDEIMKSISNQLKEIEEHRTTRNNSSSHANEAVTLLSHEVADLKEGQKSMATKLESILELLRKQNAQEWMMSLCCVLQVLVRRFQWQANMCGQEWTVMSLHCALSVLVGRFQWQVPSCASYLLAQKFIT